MEFFFSGIHNVISYSLRLDKNVCCVKFCVYRKITNILIESAENLLNFKYFSNNNFSTFVIPVNN